MDLNIWQSVQWYSDASFVLVMQVKDNARSVSGGFYSQHQLEGCLCLHLLPMVYFFIYKMHPAKNPLVHFIIYWILLLSMMLKLWDINLSFCTWEDRVNFSWNHNTGVSLQYDYCMHNETFCRSDENLYITCSSTFSYK